MKKRITILLFILIGVISLCGCGKISKEEMIRNSSKLGIKTLTSDLDSNYNTAIDKYKNNNYRIVAGIISVEEKFAKVELYNIDNEKSYLEVHFNNDDLKKLKARQKVEFVGKITKIDKSADGNIIIKVDNAYIVNFTVEFTGEFKEYEKSGMCVLYIRDENDAIYDFGTVIKNRSCNYGETVNGTYIKRGTKVTVRGKVSETVNNTVYDDDWTFTEIESITVVE